MRVSKQKLIQIQEEPVVLFADELSQIKCKGICTYYGNNPRPCTIILDPKGENPSKTLIHECIHATLNNLYNKPSIEKVARKVNRREDFVDELADELSKVLGFIIGETNFYTDTPSIVQDKEGIQ